MRDLFEKVHMDDVLSSLKEAGLYQKIYTRSQSWKHNKLINWKQIIAVQVQDSTVRRQQIE